MDLTEAQLKRYSRHILLKEVGIEGQKKILESRVLVIGAGGLGSPVLYYLAAAGVGTIGIADFDTVDLSNLQRQIIHTTEDIGKQKAESAKEKIQAVNPDVKILTCTDKMDVSNIQKIIREYDFVIDCTDNFDAKFLINDACVLEKKPFSHGGVIRLEGQTMTVKPFETACFRCLFNEPPGEDVPVSSKVGILGSVAGILGTVQATEALKVIAGIGEPLYNRLLVFDAVSMQFRKVKVNKNPECPVCDKK